MIGPDGRTRRYLRADFPDHVLLADKAAAIRSYLTLSSAPMTAALALIGRLPMLRSTLTWAPPLGSDAWHVIAENRRTGERREASGSGQSEATGRLTALAAIRAATELRGSSRSTVTMADLVSLDDALALIGRLPMLRSTLTWAPPLGSDAWHVIAENRRTGERREASGSGQSEATGRLTALAAIRAATELRGSSRSTVTMADLVSLDDALAVLG